MYRILRRNGQAVQNAAVSAMKVLLHIAQHLWGIQETEIVLETQTVRISLPPITTEEKCIKSHIFFYPTQDAADNREAKLSSVLLSCYLEKGLDRLQGSSGFWGRKRVMPGEDERCREGWHSDKWPTVWALLIIYSESIQCFLLFKWDAATHLKNFLLYWN